MNTEPGPVATAQPLAHGSQAVRSHRAADFSRAVLEDLYRYPKKRRWLARLLWLPPFGLFGAHRFYLDRTGTGIAMMFTLGGSGAWWLVDFFLIPGMIRKFNEEQVRREAGGLPPRSLSFMPPLDGGFLPESPEWATKRGGRARLGGDILILVLFGSALGAQTISTGNPEPVIAVFALVAITLLGARWDALAHIPVLSGFDRWNHRLRLFYFVTDPGGPLRLAFRPIFGLVIAPFRRRARAEARLYLQLGAWFTVIFTGIDVLQSLTLGGGFALSPRSFLSFFRDVFQTMVTVYLFAAPIGAILTTHLLLERTDKLLWTLSGIALLAVVIGMIGFSPLS